MPEKRVRFAALPKASKTEPSASTQRSSKDSKLAGPFLVATGLSAVAASMDRREKSRSKPSPRRSHQESRRRSLPAPPPTPRRSEKSSSKRAGSPKEKGSKRARDDRSDGYEWTRTVHRTTYVWYD